MTDVAMYGVSWISEDLKGALHHEGEDLEVRGCPAAAQPLFGNCPKTAWQVPRGGRHFAAPVVCHSTPHHPPQHPDPKEVKHIGPLVKNLLPEGKKLPIKRAIK